MERLNYRIVRNKIEMKKAGFAAGRSCQDRIYSLADDREEKILRQGCTYIWRYLTLVKHTIQYLGKNSIEQ